MILKLFYCLVIAAKCSFASHYADYATAFQDPRSGIGGTPTGYFICSKAIGTLGRVIDLCSFDPYLLDPDNPANPPLVSNSAFGQRSDLLMPFYSENPEERSATLFTLINEFLETIHSFSSLSHTHPEFEVLFSFTSDLTPLCDDAHVQDSFKRIFQNPSELISLRDLVTRLMAVAQAIDNKQPRDVIKALEQEVSEAFEKVPLTLSLAQHFYLPSVAMEYVSMLGDHDHTTFTGRAALTRALICYGELLKTIPDKKTSDVAKVCMTFRDIAVKVLPRRLKALVDDANTEMVPGYASMNTFLQNLHRYIFANTAVPNADDVVTLLKAWGYKTNGKSIAAVTTNTESTLREMIQDMHKISGIRARLYDVAFFDDTSSVWADFENGVTNYLSTTDCAVVASLPIEQQSDKEKELMNVRGKSIHDLNKKRLKEWPEILSRYSVLADAVTEINHWMQQVRVNVVSLIGKPDTANDLDTKPLAIPTRSSQARLWLRAQNMQQASSFNSSLSIYPLAQSILETLPETDFESLRLLGYIFAQTAKENMASLTTLKPFETQLIKLRKIWAHPRTVMADWEGLVPSISTRSEKANEAQAMAILMIRVMDLLP